MSGCTLKRIVALKNSPPPPLIIALKCPAAFAVIKLLLSISVRTHTHTHILQTRLVCLTRLQILVFWESVSYGGHKCRVFFVHRDRLYSFWKTKLLKTKYRLWPRMASSKPALGGYQLLNTWACTRIKPSLKKFTPASYRFY